jgi:hypothetical protein
MPSNIRVCENHKMLVFVVKMLRAPLFAWEKPFSKKTANVWEKNKKLKGVLKEGEFISVMKSWILF